jgi:hypothetical protein
VPAPALRSTGWPDRAPAPASCRARKKLVRRCKKPFRGCFVGHGRPSSTSTGDAGPLATGPSCSEELREIASCIRA